MSCPEGNLGLLAEIEDFLENVLSKEKLSAKAEKLRSKLVSDIEINKLGPPVLPPRRPENSSPSDLYENSDVKVVQSSSNIQEEEIDGLWEGDEYADVDDPEPEQCREYEVPLNTKKFEPTKEDEYEVPVMLKIFQSEKDGDTDSCYSGSFESYEEDESIKDDPQLPKQKLLTKKRKSKERNSTVCPINTLENVTCQGELYQAKGGSLIKKFSKKINKELSYSKRTCVISDGRLIVYKEETDEVPVYITPLKGYETECLKKEGKYSYELNVTHPSSKSHEFFTDNKTTAENWYKNFFIACYGGEGPSVTDFEVFSDQSTANGENKDQKDVPIITVATTPEETNIIRRGSNESNKDSLSVAKDSQISNSSSSLNDSTSKSGSGVGAMISKTIRTFGKNKGKDTKEAMKVLEIQEDPSVIRSGYVKVMSESYLQSKKWFKRFCILKDKSLEFYKEASSPNPEFFLSLIGVDIDLGDKDGKHELAFKLLQDSKVIYVEAPNVVEHGDWLSALLKETGCRSPDFKKQEEGSDTSRGSPPPLPSNPPPDSTPPTMKRIFDTPSNGENNNAIYDEVMDITKDRAKLSSKEQAVDKDMYDDTQFVSKRFRDVEKNNNKVETSADKEDADENYLEVVNEGSVDFYDDVSTPPSKRKVGGKILQIRSELETKANAKSTTSPKSLDENGVIKCHSGSTIAEDAVILRDTKNPLLKELRKSKASKGLEGEKDLEKLKDDIFEMKRNMTKIKKQRLDIKSKKLYCKSVTEKAELDKKLQDFDKQLEENEKELTKLQVIAQEHSLNQVQRKSSLNSPRSSKPSSRNNSFKSDTLPNKSAIGKTSSLASTSPRDRNVKTKTPLSNSRSSGTSSYSKKVGGESKVTSSSSSTQGWSAKSSSSSWQPVKYTPKAYTSQVSSAGGKGVKPENKSATGVKLSSANRLNKQTPSAIKKLDPPKVQDKLKLWESKSKEADSNC